MLYDDKQLLESVKKGNKNVFKEFYIAHKTEYERWFVKHFTFSKEELNDLYQQSMLILYENILQGKLNELQSSLKTYLFSIGKNLALKQAAKAKVRFLHQDRLTEHWQFFGEDINEASDEKKQLVVQAVEQQQEPCKSILKLFYFEQKKLDEIVEILSYKNKATLKAQKSRCLQYLKNEVSKKDGINS